MLSNSGYCPTCSSWPTKNVKYVVTVLICISSITSDADNLVLCFFATRISCLGYVCLFFCSFFYWVGCIFLIGLQNILYILHAHILPILCIMISSPHVYICNFSLHLLRCIFSNRVHAFNANLVESFCFLFEKSFSIPKSNSFSFKFF